MRLNSLNLQNFRNYNQLELNFSDSNNINLFIGNNAQGKTNIIESIFLLALAKSFRTKKYESLIRWQNPFTRIIAEISRKDKNYVMKCKQETHPQLLKDIQIFNFEDYRNPWITVTKKKKKIQK